MQTSATETETSLEGVEYLRRVYASTREWYAAAERKAQLLLTVNGAFVTIVFGALLNKADMQLSAQVGLAGTIFFGLCGASVVGAVTCAALSLWSLHGKSAAEVKRLGISPAVPAACPEDLATYPGEALWYFGRLAHLQRDAAVNALRMSSQRTEAEALSHNVVDLARKVLRKHRWVNAGWALTAVAFIALAGAAASVFTHA